MVGRYVCEVKYKFERARLTVWNKDTSQTLSHYVLQLLYSIILLISKPLASLTLMVCENFTASSRTGDFPKSPNMQISKTKAQQSLHKV
jgi:hypothetical protein